MKTTNKTRYWQDKNYAGNRPYTERTGKAITACVRGA